MANALLPSISPLVGSLFAFMSQLVAGNVSHCALSIIAGNNLEKAFATMIDGREQWKRLLSRLKKGLKKSGDMRTVIPDPTTLTNT
jgi:hypothetical protein